ncbi:MAG: HlyD family type I secretion periplasmic adaptor subunit [Campylobacteraceae bacterium]|jgi:hemolysin D|nr:HlyD family type I secretion periplasmic adaptor subunit [Campylobacteraceae bacterium]
MSKNKNDSYEFQPLLVEIEDRPLNPLGHVILWLIVLILIIGAVWLYFGKIDVVVSARGKIVPSGEIKILQPIETGVVSKILIKEGDYVNKNQVLMQIDPTVTQTNLDSKIKNLSVINLEVQRLKALTEDRTFVPNTNAPSSVIKEQTSLYFHQKGLLQESKMQFDLRKNQTASQLSSAKSENTRLKSMLEKEQNTADRMEKVLDIIAKREYEETQKNIINLSEQLFQSEQKISEINHRLDEIEKEQRVYIQKMMSEWFSMLVEKQKESRELESQINAIGFQNRQQQIKAPLNGYIGKLLVHTEGGVVTPAEKLLTIVPEDAPLIIKATVLNQDIGFITNNMNASVKIDTFTFQKYGLIDAEVFFISNDAVEDEKLGPVYEIKLNPKKLSLEVDGKERSLEPGMSVTVEIKVGKRRIIEFFIYPIIRYLDEGMSVR